MSEKKIKNRPSLKNFLSTGKVSMSDEVVKETKMISPSFDWLLKLLSPKDLETWEPIFASGAGFKEEKTDIVGLREFFRNMDRIRFTLYALDSEGADMRMIRSGVQIREPYVFFLLWDDDGAATIYK